MAAIDIIVPVCNGETHLAPALESLRQQTFGDFRVLIIDDGSTDGSAAIAERFVAADDRFVLIRRPHRGIVDCLNEGLSLATAPYIARLDADDICLPARLAVQIAYLEAHPDVVAVSAAHMNMDETGAVYAIARDYAPSRFDPFFIPAREPYIPHTLLMTRRSALAAIGGYRHIRLAEDADLYWRLVGLGRLVFLDQILGIYRVHAGSVSGRSLAGGKVQAFYAQLAALSYRRRASMAADFAFSRDLAAVIGAETTFDAMIGHVGAPLSPSEREYLWCASHIKVLELASFRPYRLDYATIRDSLRCYLRLRRLSAESPRHARSLLRGAIRRFARQPGQRIAALKLKVLFLLIVRLRLKIA